MPVTPRGVVSPNDPDNWDLIVDLAAMGVSIDTAIGNAESGRPGTAAQRTSFTASAPNGFLWQDTDGIKMIWRKDGAAWVPAVWNWSGTTTEMNAFAAPDGFSWTSTTNEVTYVRVSGSWRGGIVTGAGVLSSVGSGNTLSVATTVAVKNGETGWVNGMVTLTRSNDFPASGTIMGTLAPNYRPQVPLETVQSTLYNGNFPAMVITAIDTSGVIRLWSTIANARSLDVPLSFLGA